MFPQNLALLAAVKPDELDINQPTDQHLFIQPFVQLKGGCSKRVRFKLNTFKRPRSAIVSMACTLTLGLSTKAVCSINRLNLDCRGRRSGEGGQEVSKQTIGALQSLQSQ